MNRRQLLGTLAALPAASQLRGQSESKYRLRSGLVAYSYRTQLAAKSMTYEDLIRKIADWGIDGLDCTVYWFPDTPNTSNEYLASLRRTAFKYGVDIYNAGVRVQLCQPTAELQRAQFENIKKWVDVADRIGAPHMRVFGGPVPKDATQTQAIGWGWTVAIHPRASLRSGTSRLRKRRPASPFVEIAARGWLISCAIDAAISPTVAICVARDSLI